MIGTLYLCATPIGNLEDMTFRVINTLKNVDYIAAEDTRHTLKLLNHFEISTPMVSYHMHNEKQKSEILIAKLLDGKNIALVSDAGMPGISDPGEIIVKKCHENNINVTALPGANALLTALVISGISTRRFTFEGFLPNDKKERKQILSFVEKEHRTMIFYESPHDLLKTLKEFINIFKDRQIAVARELTKKFENIKKGTSLEMFEFFSKNQPRGEFVIIVEGTSLDKLRQEEIQTFLNMDILEHLNIYLNQGISEKDAMKKVAKDRGVSKKDIYSIIKI